MDLVKLSPFPTKALQIGTTMSTALYIRHIVSYDLNSFFNTFYKFYALVILQSINYVNKVSEE